MKDRYGIVKSDRWLNTDEIAPIGFEVSRNGHSLYRSDLQDELAISASIKQS